MPEDHDTTSVTQAFIAAHADADVRRLALQAAGTPGVDLPFALDQISGRQKARSKLPTWAAIDAIVYPPRLSMEQCSSELTARYKAELALRHLQPASGGSTAAAAAATPASGGSTAAPLRFADLTGGFGVDFAFIAQALTQSGLAECKSRHGSSSPLLLYMEQNPEIFAVSSKNISLLVPSATCLCADGVEFLRQATDHFNLIYLDPARRDSHGQRTYGISDCTPDVSAITGLLLRKADTVIIKLSPMLDWRKAVTDLGTEHVSEVHIVAVNNECKELLITLHQPPFTSLPSPVTSHPSPVTLHTVTLHTVNILPDGQSQRFACQQLNPPLTTPQPSARCAAAMPQPPSYLYEPHAAIMKAGCFAALCSRFAVQQLESNSHLFLSDSLIPDFPGRAFRLMAVTSLNKHELRQHLRGVTQANITVRNFPMDVDALRRKLKVRDGGSTYIFATTLSGRRHVLLICQK